MFKLYIKTLFVIHVLTIIGFGFTILKFIDPYYYLPGFLNNFDLQFYIGLLLILTILFRYIFGFTNTISLEIDKFDIMLFLIVLGIILSSLFNFYELNLSFDLLIILKYSILFFSSICLKLYYLNFKSYNIDYLDLIYKSLLFFLFLTSFFVFFYFNSFNFFTETSTFYFNLRQYYVIWLNSWFIPEKYLIISILLIPTLYYNKWIKNHLNIFLSIFVILFLKVKGGIVILSIIFFKFILDKQKNVLLWLLFPLVLYISYKFFEEAYVYFDGIIFDKDYQINSYGIHNRVYFFIDQLTYLKFNLLNGYGMNFFQSIKVLEDYSYLSSHSSLLDNLIYFGILNFFIYYLFLFQISYFKENLFQTFLLCCFILILLVSKDRIIDFLPLLIFFKYLKYKKN